MLISITEQRGCVSIPATARKSKLIFLFLSYQEKRKQFSAGLSLPEGSQGALNPPRTHRGRSLYATRTLAIQIKRALPPRRERYPACPLPIRQPRAAPRSVPNARHIFPGGRLLPRKGESRAESRDLHKTPSLPLAPWSNLASRIARGGDLSDSRGVVGRFRYYPQSWSSRIRVVCFDVLPPPPSYSHRRSYPILPLLLLHPDFSALSISFAKRATCLPVGSVNPTRSESGRFFRS